ncbi:Duffy receptor beta form [Bienertia sinuspersici]
MGFIWVGDQIRKIQIRSDQIRKIQTRSDQIRKFRSDQKILRTKNNYNKPDQKNSDQIRPDQKSSDQKISDQKNSDELNIALGYVHNARYTTRLLDILAYLLPKIFNEDVGIGYGHMLWRLDMLVNVDDQIRSEKFRSDQTRSKKFSSDQKISDQKNSDELNIALVRYHTEVCHVRLGAEGKWKVKSRSKAGMMALRFGQGGKFISTIIVFQSLIETNRKQWLLYGVACSIGTTHK